MNGELDDIELAMNYLDSGHTDFPKDLELLKNFNIYTGRKKNGLPPSYGQKHYEEMNDDKKERRELKNQEINYYFYEKEQRETFPTKNLTEDHRVYISPLF